MDSFLTYVSLAFWGGFSFYLLIKLVRSVRLVPNKTELIVERLGRYEKTLGPGIHLLIPFIDRVAYAIDRRETALEVPPQECFTKDNVKVEVDGIIYMSVENAKQACYGVTHYGFAAVQLAQTTTRSVIGTLELDKTFEEREAINARVISVLNEVSAGWGIKVHRYEVKNIVPPTSVREAMERQMSAERDRRALLAQSEGERQSRINKSEGMKMELINRSEGEKQRRINEAEGKAQEILALARATAESIEKVGAAMVLAGGPEAVRLRLAQAYLGKLQGLATGNADVVLPLDLTQLGDLLAGVGLRLDDEGAAAAAPAPVASVSSGRP